MRNLYLGMIIIILCAFTSTLYGQDLTAEQIVRKAEQSVYPDNFVMRATIETLKSGEVESHMDMEIRYKRDTGTRIELLAPARSHGVRFLQKEGNLWMFNPRAGSGQAIRLSPRASFQGTVFSNRDVGDPQYTTEYTVRVVGRESIDVQGSGQVDAIVVEGIARNAQVAYAKVRLWIRAKDYMILKAEYFAKSGLPFKTVEFTNIRRLAGKERPSVLRMLSMDQKDRVSIMTIHDLVEDPAMADAIFTLSALTR